MYQGGMSAASVAGYAGLKGERSGRPYPHTVQEAPPVARDPVGPTGTDRSPEEPSDSLNVKGAFPLLLIGGFAVASSIVLALQSAALPSHHLPIWVVVAVAGATILGAGVFSLFWAEVEEDRGERGGPPNPVEGTDREGSTRHEEMISPHRPGLASSPPWWEGPPTESTPTSVQSLGPAVPRREAAPAPVPVTARVPPRSPDRPTSRGSAGGAVGSEAAPRAPVRSAPTVGPVGPTLRRGFPKEFMDSLAELETLADRELKLSARLPSKARPVESLSCADCRSEISSGLSPSRCSDCRRRLCVGCAISSQLEDGDVRCIECRVRESRSLPTRRTRVERG